MTSGGWSNQTSRRIVVVVGTPYSGLFFYDPVPDLGNLVGSWAVGAGTDPYGNNYPGGIELHNGAGSINLSQGGTEQRIDFSTGNPSITPLVQFLSATTEGTGNAQFDGFEISGSRNSTNQDNAGLNLTSSSTDLTSLAAVSLFYSNPIIPGGFATFLEVSYQGAVISAGSIAAVQPGTGTGPGNVAVAETWHTPTLANPSLWTTVGAAQPVRYQLMPDGTALLDGELLTTGVGPWPANVNLFSLPAGYRPTQGEPFVTRSDIAVSAGQCTVNVLNSGGVQNGQPFTAAGQRLWFTNVRFPVT